MRGRRFAERLAVGLGILALAAGAACTSREKSRTGGHRQSLEQIRSAHQQVLDQMTSIYRRRVETEATEKENEALARRGWMLAGDWAAAYLDEHPKATAAQLADALSRLVPGRPAGDRQVKREEDRYELRAETAPLGADRFAVLLAYTADRAAFSTFLVLSRRAPGGWAVSWRVLDLADKHFKSRDEIGRWAYLPAGWSYGDGPLLGELHALPPDAHGLPRFYVNAWSAGDGGTRLRQFSVWKWTGTEAAPLVINAYYATVDGPPDRLDGERIVVTTKEGLGTFSSCGMCSEPVGRWTIRLTADGVADEGTRLVEPNYRVIDDLFSRIAQRHDASDLAARPVVSQLRRMIPPEQKEKYPFGMLSSGKTTRQGDVERFDVSFDAASFVFTVEQRDGRPFVSGVKVLRWQ